MPDDIPTGAELDAALSSDFVPTDGTTIQLGDAAVAATDTTTQVQAGAITPTPPAELQPAWNPEGPGDPERALSAKNKEIADLRAATQAAAQRQAYYEQMLADPRALEQVMAYHRQQAEEAQRSQPPDLSKIDPVIDPEGAYNALSAIIQNQNQQIASLQQGLHNGLEYATREGRFQSAVTDAKRRYTDYEDVIGRLAPFEKILDRNAFLGPDGPELAYQFARTLPAVTQQQAAQPAPQQQAPVGQPQNGMAGYIDQLVSQRLRQMIPTPPTPAPSIGSLPASATNSDASFDLAGMPTDAIEKMGVHEWHMAALKGLT